MRWNVEERCVTLANYIIENGATVRKAAKQFGISKSTVHTEVTKMNVSEGTVHPLASKRMNRPLAYRFPTFLIL